MKNKFIALIMVLLAACSGNQTQHIQAPSLVYADAGSVPQIDLSTYDVLIVPSLRVPHIVTSNENGEFIAPLRLNQPAPYAGVLFNSAAVARIEVEFQGVQTRCIIDRKADLQRVIARAIADIQHLENALGSQRAAYQIMLENRDQEINRLYRSVQYLSNNNSSIMTTLLWSIGSFIVGAGLGATIGFFGR